MRALGVVLLVGLMATACPAVPPTAVNNSIEQRLTAQTDQSSNRGHKGSVWVVEHWLFTRIRGMTVENRDGQYLGTIEDFIVDEQSGEVTFGVISSGGLLGFHKKLKAVPASILSMATAKLGVVSLDAGRRRWERAPVFKRGDVAGFRKDPSTAEALYRYYGVASGGSREHEPNGSQGMLPAIHSGRIGQEQSMTGRPRLQTAKLDFASDLLGKTVVDNRDQSLGQISDLLLDLTSQRPTLAILSPGKELRQSGRFALPLSLLGPKNADALRIEANPRNFALAPALDDYAWQSQQARKAAVIYRFQ